MKTLAKILVFFLVAYWLLLSHVSFNFMDDAPSLKEVSEDGKYKVLLRDIYPTNPIGIYCLLTTESPIYFALFDSDDNYIGQSSPFVCYNKWSVAGFTFPGEEFTTDTKSFIVLDDSYNGELNISTKDKRWWSTLLAIFN